MLNWKLSSATALSESPSDAVLADCSMLAPRPATWLAAYARVYRVRVTRTHVHARTRVDTMKLSKFTHVVSYCSVGLVTMFLRL